MLTCLIKHNMAVLFMNTGNYDFHKNLHKMTPADILLWMGEGPWGSMSPSRAAGDYGC